MADDKDLLDGENDDLRAQLEAAYNQDQAAEPEVEAAPETESAEARAQRARDELGRFAKAEEAAQKAEEPAKAPEQVKAPEQAQQAAPEAPAAIRPPPGWSVAAKSVFESLPPAVKEAVAKRESEVNQGFAKLAEYKPLEPYVELARRGGTTLDKALESYTGIEQMLRQDPVRGFAQIAQNLGAHPVQIAQQILAAYGQQPSSNGVAPEQPQIDPSIQQMLQRQLQPLQQTVQQLTAERQAQTQAQIDAAIERFYNDPANKYAENVSDSMVPFINQRKAMNPSERYEDTLKWAYEQAVWANPETREVLLNEQLQQRAAQAKAKADQARAAAKSITGSPVYGSAIGEEAPLDDIRAELGRQYAAAGGRI